MTTDEIDVLIAGAGATGLTLACDLRRRGVSVRLIDAAPHAFEGSRAKGVQPRSVEVFDDLGVLSRLEARSSLYPPLGIHLGPLTLKRTMIALHEATADTPHANTLLVPQYATEASLRERLVELGGQVEYSTRLDSFTQDASGISASIDSPAGTQAARAKFLVGADGGSSTVRHELGLAFEGTTDESDRMIIADVTVSGLTRDRWHIWPRAKGRFVALCPLPGDTFQLMLKLRPKDPADMDVPAIDRLVRDVVGGSRVRVNEIHWSSLWRPNTRLAEHYRSGRVFLAGDAAHVHPPTGAQGLNTGIQDAYNLGWKLGQALAGAPDSLLESYEAERQPVAARVLGLAAGLYSHLADRPLAATKRGDEERQLSLTYRGGPLAPEASHATKVSAGDRAPDAPVVLASGSSTTLFDALRGPSFGLIMLGARAAAGEEVSWPSDGAAVTPIRLDESHNREFRDIYGVDGDAVVLVRPDGYVAAVATESFDQVGTWRALPLFPSTSPPTSSSDPQPPNAKV